MKDQLGLYYYPFPQNKRVRMYVSRKDGVIHFRLWNADDSRVWEQHEWAPYEAIRQAAAMYDGKQFNPQQAYSIDVARELLLEDAKAEIPPNNEQA